MASQDYRDEVFLIAGAEESSSIPPSEIDAWREEVAARFGVALEQVAKDVDAMRHHHIGGDAWQ